MRPALLVISDGAGGIISACELGLPQSLRQRCLIHRARNILAKVPTHAEAKVKANYCAIFEGIEEEAGSAPKAETWQRAELFATKWCPLFPSTVECPENDFEHLITYLRFPKEHWKRIRHSNFIERTFGDTRGRAKVIGSLPGEQNCLSLVWAVLDRASKGWQGVKTVPTAVRYLRNLRQELIEPPPKYNGEEVIKARVTTAA